MRNWLLGPHQLQLRWVKCPSHPNLSSPEAAHLACLVPAHCLMMPAPRPQSVSKESPHTITVLPSTLPGILIAQYPSRNPYCPLDKIQVSQPIPAWLGSCPPLSSSSISLTQAVLLPSWPCVKILLHTFQLPAFDQAPLSARIYCSRYLQLVNLP